MAGVFCHIVAWNSAASLPAALRALDGQGLERIVVTDNNSDDDTAVIIESTFAGKVELNRNRENLGFCAAHNQGVFKFLKSGCEYLLILNPDLSLAPGAVGEMITAAESDSGVGIVTPKLLRADKELRPVDPPIIDAAGMSLEPSLRHFDRGSEEPDRGQYDREEDVFGGTGAALLLTRKCVESLMLNNLKREKDAEKIYPQLAEGRETRALLFDEAFFAYREDAELCWRAKRKGIRCRYVPAALGYHVRMVTPGRRAKLSPAVNRASVRNRFLLQLVHYSPLGWPQAIIPGLIVRNLLVLAGVVLKERTSLPALRDVWVLFPRAWERRRALFK